MAVYENNVNIFVEMRHFIILGSARKLIIIEQFVDGLFLRPGLVSCYTGKKGPKLSSAVCTHQ